MGVGGHEPKWEIPPVRQEDMSRELDGLVKRAMGGDDGALYALCERIARRVFFLASHILRNPDDAEDVSQEALIRVCEKIGTLRSPEAFWSWLSKIVANEARMHIRKNAGHGVVVNMDDYLESIAEKDEALLPQEYAENKEVRRMVLESIDSLPPRQREAVLLHYYGGLSVNEIAGEMRIDHSNASRYLALAREKLRIRLEERPAGMRLRSAAVLPLSGLLREILERESRGGSTTADWERRALEQCRRAALLRPAPAAVRAAPKALLRRLIGLAATGVVAAGIYLGAGYSGGPEASPPGVGAVGRIDFSGGESQGEDYIYLNPADASPRLEGANGFMTAIEWYITSATGKAEDRLYSGVGGDVGDALIRLRESGGDGRYTLYVLFGDKSGGVYRVYETFQIRSE